MPEVEVSAPGLFYVFILVSCCCKGTCTLKKRSARLLALILVIMTCMLIGIRPIDSQSANQIHRQEYECLLEFTSFDLGNLLFTGC